MSSGGNHRLGDVEDGDARRAPAGFFALGGFFLFGSVMAAYAAVSLAVPGTVLDRGWALNPGAREQLAHFGRMAAIPFVLLAGAMLAAALGWFGRRPWAWMLGAAIIAVNLAGDFIQLLRGELAKGAAGVVLAGLVLAAVVRPGMRQYFRSES